MSAPHDLTQLSRQVDRAGRRVEYVLEIASPIVTG